MPIGTGTGGGAGAIRAGRAFVELFLKDNLVLRSLDRLKQRFSQFGSFLKRTGAQFLALGVGISTPLTLATRTFAEFDDAMRLAGAVAGATADELGRMTEKAKELGRTTSFTAAQVALLMVELGRAGFKPDEINEMTAAVLNLARATGTEAPLAAEIMAATLRQFGLGASDATRVADGLTAAANKSNASVEGLGESLKYAGPIANDLNISLEDTLALLGALANVGIKGSDAGTGLRRLSVIAAANSDAFRKFGVETQDSKGQLRSLVDILDDLFIATAKMGNAQRAAAFDEIFGLLGITSASALSKNTASVRELRDAIVNMGGVADKTAKEMDAGLGGAFRILRSAIEGIAIAFGEALAPVLMAIGANLTFVAGLITHFVRENREVAAVIAGIAAGLVVGGVALIGFGIAIGGISTAIGGLIGAWALLKSTVLFLLSPVGLVTAAVVGLVVAWATMTEDGKATMQSLSESVMSFGDLFRSTWGGITDAIKAQNMKLAMDIAVAGMEAAWARGMRVLTEIWLKFRNSVLAGWKAVQLATEDAVGGFMAMFLHMTEGKQAAMDFVKQVEQMQKREIKDFGAEGKRQRDEAFERERDALGRLHGLIVEARERMLEQERMNEEKKKQDLGGVPPAGSGGAGSLRVSDVAGGLAAPGLRERFGLKAGQFEKESLITQKKIELNTGQLNKRLGDVAKSLRFH